MKHNIYIDTNVYLTFFHFSNEDLNELKKLINLINVGDIKLFIPEQTLNEFNRNREVKIADALSKLKISKLENQFPMICHAYDEYENMKKAIKQFEINKAKLLDKIQHDAEKSVLKADDVLSQLFSKAKIINTTPRILNDAKIRFDIGNPPGKDKSYGDAINWESLLCEFPMYEDMYFISDDKDYYSKLNDKEFNAYLSKEWNEFKKSKIIYFKRLSEFFKKYYPNIEISDETEKDLVIKNLSEAYSFENAKDVIRVLRKYDGFSINQLNAIATAFSTNNQIYWIKNQSPVRNARYDIIEANVDKIEPGIYKLYERVFEIESQD